MPNSKKQVLDVKAYPRASSFYALDNCDLAYRLSKASGEEPPTIYSDRGSDVHQVISGQARNVDKLDSDVIDLAKELSRQRSLRLEKWMGESTAPIKEYLERRLWLRQGLIPVYSGQPDNWVLQEARVFLSDYKSGWHPIDHYVATNAQIRAYVPLIDEELDHRMEEVTAAIHKPGKKSPPALFGRVEIDEARSWALDVVARAKDATRQKPNPGPWCTYCSGKVLCPAWQDRLVNLGELVSSPIADLPDLVLRDLAPKLEMASTVIDKLSNRLYERVKARPDFFKDWRFDSGDERRVINSVSKAFEALVDKDGSLSTEAFLKACRANVTELEAAVRQAKGLSVSGAREWMLKVLEGVLEKKRNKDKLVYDPGRNGK